MPMTISRILRLQVDHPRDNERFLMTQDDVRRPGGYCHFKDVIGVGEFAEGTPEGGRANCGDEE